MKPLCAVFGSAKAGRISVEMLRNYVANRKATGVANKTINLQIGVMRSVLKRAKLWHIFADEIRPLPVHTQIGRALTLDEKLRLTRKAAIKPEWQSAHLAMILALNTTMRACEIKSLRWYDVDFFASTIAIRKSKTQAGQRMIPLNADALDAIKALYHRASAIGETHPDHFVFAASENGTFDRRSRRRAGVLLGGVYERPQAYPRFASMTQDTMGSLSWPSPRRVTPPSWQSPGTSRGKCWSTTATFVWT
jgi:integrase